SFTDTHAGGPYTIMQASDGNFYGTTFGGGVCSTYYGSTGGYFGTIHKITPSGAISTLVKFTGGNGAWPQAPLVEGTDGNFYGCTSQGGPRTDFPSCGCWEHVGTLFRTTPHGDLNTLAFFNGYNGLFPRANLVQAADGNFYGTTAYGGGANPDGYNGLATGEIFRLTVPGADAPKIISTARSGTNVTLTWLALAGRSYQLQFTTNLAQTSWINVGSAVIATNTTTSADDPMGIDAHRFYRL